MQEFPQYMHYYAIKKYRYEGTPTANDTNRNMLLFRDPTVDGLKTGHTEAAGYCLIATAKRDFRPGCAAASRASGSRRLPVNRSRQRVAEAAELGLHRVRTGQTVRRQSAGCHASVWKGTQKTAKLGRTRRP